MEHNRGYDADRLGVDEELIPKWSRRKHNVVAREFSIIDVGNGLDVKINRGEYCHKREHGRSVG